MSTSVPHLPHPPSHPWAPPMWDASMHSNLRSVVTSACKRLPHNAEAHFHLGLVHMRNADGEDALRAFTSARSILEERARRCTEASLPVPPRLTKSLARLRAHTAQAAHLAAASKLSREERAPLLDRLQADLVASTTEDNTQPDVWNALALLHLGEGGFRGARDVLRCICEAFPDYLDALNNLGLAELALGDEHAAVACFQKVVLRDNRHSEALSNYGLILLRRGVYEAAGRSFRAATEGADEGGFGVAFAWGGLAIAEAACGNMVEAEKAANEAENTADSESKSRFSMLRACVHARRVVDTLRRGVLSFDGRASVFVKATSTPTGKLEVESEESTDTCEDSRAQVDPFANPSRNSHGRERGSQEGSGQQELPASQCFDREKIIDDPRAAVERIVGVMRTVARDIRSSAASSALGAVLRLRHEYSWEESGNRNYGAEAAERLVDALETDEADASSWVQLALLQLGAGEYESARDFCMQAVARTRNHLGAWNALGVSYQLSNQIPEAFRALQKAAIAAVETGDQKRNTAHLHGPRMSESFEQDSVTVPPSVDENDAGTCRKSTDSEKSGICALDGETTLKDIRCSSDGVGSAASDDIPMAFPLSVLSSIGLGDNDVHKDLNRSCLAALAAIFNNIGNVKRQEGGETAFAEAQEAFEKSLRLGGESPAVYNNLALLYISMNRLEDAEKMLTHALSIAPHFDCSASNLIKLRRLKSSTQEGAPQLGSDLDES